MLEFLEDEMEESRGKWERVSVLARSLVRQVQIEWNARNFKEKGKWLNEVKVFSLAKDHLWFWFKSETECNAILQGGSWIVAS